jgi:hypothetical protein
MGQQQLLLVILGTIIVGIAISVAVLMFNDQASATNRDEVVADLAHLGSLAQAYYRKPRILGGGGGTFDGLTIRTLTSSPANPRNLNGTYTLEPDPVGGSPSYVTIRGVGTESGNSPAGGVDGKVTVVMLVYADSIRVDDTLTN